MAWYTQATGNSMKCAFCDNPVSAWRILAGSRFCSRDHQRRHLARSARTLRDMEDVYGSESLAQEMYLKRVEAEPKRSQPGNVITVLALFTVGFLALAVLALPGGGKSSSTASLPRLAVDYTLHTPTKSTFAASLRNTLTPSNPVTLRDSFGSGLSNWVGSEGAGTWAKACDYVMPGSCVCGSRPPTSPTMRWSFSDKIERKGMGWAFRAPDLHNYYGAELLIARSGPLPNADLVRFVVLNGHETERLQLPLPLTLDRHTDYRVHVSIRGDRFLTSVNGEPR